MSIPPPSLFTLHLSAMVASFVFALLGAYVFTMSQDAAFPYLFAAILMFCLGLLAESWPSPEVRDTPHGGKLP